MGNSPCILSIYIISGFQKDKVRKKKRKEGRKRKSSSSRVFDQWAYHSYLAAASPICLNLLFFAIYVEKKPNCLSQQSTFSNSREMMRFYHRIQLLSFNHVWLPDFRKHCSCSVHCSVQSDIPSSDMPFFCLVVYKRSKNQKAVRKVADILQTIMN